MALHRMNELAILVVAVLVGFGVGYVSRSFEIKYLREQNQSLLGSLYNRVGYRPHEHKAEIAPDLSDRIPIKDEFPDLLSLQEAARND